MSTPLQITQFEMVNKYLRVMPILKVISSHNGKTNGSPNDPIGGMVKLV